MVRTGYIGLGRLAPKWVDTVRAYLENGQVRPCSRTRLRRSRFPTSWKSANRCRKARNRRSAAASRSCRSTIKVTWFLNCRNSFPPTRQPAGSSSPKQATNASNWIYKDDEYIGFDREVAAHGKAWASPGRRGFTIFGRRDHISKPGHAEIVQPPGTAFRPPAFSAAGACYLGVPPVRIARQSQNLRKTREKRSLLSARTDAGTAVAFVRQLHLHISPKRKREIGVVLSLALRANVRVARVVFPSRTTGRFIQPRSSAAEAARG